MRPPVPIPADPVVAALEEALGVVGARRSGVGDATGPHRARVATRRLDAWLRLGGVRTLRSDLRWLRLELADARDLDVVRAMELPKGVRAGLARPHREGWARARAAAASPRTAGLLQALRVLPPVVPDRRRVGRLVAAAVAPLQEDPAGLHARRRLLRRLRFTLEWLGQPVEVLVTVQDALGAVSDDAVLRRWWPEAPEPDIDARLAAAHAAWALHLPVLEALR